MDGLKHAWNNGFRRVQVESDNLEAVQQILNSGSAKTSNGLTVAIREMMRRHWEVSLRHVNRKANAVADWLARDIRDKGYGQNFYMDPCLAVLDIMNHDLQHSLQVPDTGIGVTVWLPYVLFFLHQLREVF
ncbi:hypothetical protein GQ457_09G022630 [Hibiscus cannabinus]